MSRVCVRELSLEKLAVIIKVLKTVLALSPDSNFERVVDRLEQ